ncbi:MAG: hypothetical protein J6Y52_06350 [Bacteroidales bacterium]|nr:hypothetical protein [Bacteroidales bacterium]
MKKVVFFFVLTLFSALSVTAQMKYTSAVMTNNYVTHPDKTPFDTWGGNYYVAFGRDATSPYNPVFYLVDISGYSTFLPLTPIPAPSFVSRSVSVSAPSSAGLLDFTVNDIYVVDDYAFFCGYGVKKIAPEVTVDVAVVGYFNLNDFFTNNVQVNYLILYDSINYSDYPVSLEQLVAYRSPSGYDVVAYGMKTGGQNQVVEIKDIMSSPITFSCANMPFSNPLSLPAPDEQLVIDDIFLTKNNVVFTGHDHNIITTATNYPWYIFGGKGDVVMDICDPWINPNYYLPSADESEGYVLGAALEGDSFAMAYVHPDGITEDRTIRLRVIDPISVSNPYSQEFEAEKGELVHKMVYLPKVKTVDLIVEEPFTTRFFQLDPYATANYSSVFFELGGAYQRIRAKDGEHLISSYGNSFYIDDRTANLPHSNQSCPANKEKKVQMIPELQPNQAQYGSPTPPYNIISAQTNDAVQTHAITTDCFSYE